MKPSITGMYAVIWAMLIVVMPWPREPRWAEIEEVFGRNDALVKRWSKETVEWMRHRTIAHTYEEGLAHSFKLTTALAARLYQHGEAVCDSLQRAKYGPFSSQALISQLRMLDCFLDSVATISPTDDLWRQIVWQGHLPFAYFSGECRTDSCYAVVARSLLKNLTPEGRRVLLSALQTNVRNASLAAIEHLYATMNWPFCGWGLEKISLVATPATPYVLPNQPVRADLQLLVTTRRFRIRLTARTGEVSEDGNIGHWEGRAGVAGLHNVSGQLSCWMDTTLVVKPWSFQYRVIPKTATIGLDRSYTVNRGIPAPLTIDAPSYPPDALTLRIPGARVEVVFPNHYRIHTDRRTPVLLTAYLILASQEGPDTICIQPIEVRTPPIPRILLHYCDAEAPHTLAGLRTLNSITLCTDDEDLDPALWRMQRYTITLLRPGGSEEFSATIHNSLSWRDDADATALLGALQPGDRLLFHDATAAAPDGRDVKLTPISIPVKE